MVFLDHDLLPRDLKKGDPMKTALAVLILLCACSAMGQTAVTFDNQSRHALGDLYEITAYCPDGTPFATLLYSVSFPKPVKHKHNKHEVSTEPAPQPDIGSTDVRGRCNYRGEGWTFPNLDRAEAWVSTTYAKEACGDVHCYYAPSNSPTHVIIDK